VEAEGWWWDCKDRQWRARGEWREKLSCFGASAVMLLGGKCL